MASGALFELQSNISRHAVDAQGMAFLACDLAVHSGQEKPRLAMVEAASGRFPIGAVVALCALAAEPPLMFIFMTAGACGGKTEKRQVQVADGDRFSLGCDDLLRIMAGGAGDSGVFTVQSEAGFRMVKLCKRPVPPNNGEAHPVVFGVAAHARYVSARAHVGGVQTALLLQTSSDLLVAVKTAKGSAPWRKGVTSSAPGRTFQVAVHLR